MSFKIVSVFCSASAVCLFFLPGCAALQPDIAVKSELLAKMPAAYSSSVAVVIPDVAANLPLPTRLAKLLEAELSAQGFQVKKSASQADLVVMAVFTQAMSSEGSDLPDANSSGAIRATPFTIDSLTTFQSGSSMAGGSDLSVLTPRRKAGIVVTAITRESWLNALSATEVVKVWRVVATTTQYNSGDDVMATLVHGCGPTFKSLLPGSH